jgi:hypothetical protein
MHIEISCPPRLNHESEEFVCSDRLLNRRDISGGTSEELDICMSRQHSRNAESLWSAGRNLTGAILLLFTIIRIGMLRCEIS